MTKRTDQLEAGLWLTPRQAAAETGLTPSWLARMSRNGQLTTIRPSGTHRRYLRSEIEALAAPSKREATK